jgi:hypothetical protein
MTQKTGRFHFVKCILPENVSRVMSDETDKRHNRLHSKAVYVRHETVNRRRFCDPAGPQLASLLEKGYKRNN